MTRDGPGGEGDLRSKGFPGWPTVGRMITSEELAADRAGCAAAHVSLLRTVNGLTDADVRRDSLLPGWSVGHVLNHLRRNAEGFTAMLRAALP